MKKLPVILACVFAAAIVCIAAVLGVRMKNESNVTVAAQSETGAGEWSTAEEPSAYSYEAPSVWESYSQTETVTAPSFEQSSSSAAAVIPSVPVLPGQSETETAAPQTLTEKASAVVTTIVNTAFGEMFTMPKAPKYVPKQSRIDFNTASLASYKFDPDGSYYYTDDKNAWQKGFGYNQTYDKLAIVSAMYYDTVRNTFTYEGKDWLIQLWKGQYGYSFVGAEIGVYTKTRNSSGQYACADKDDWLRMEMCFIWDEEHNGNYKPIFVRPYDTYWWCTGFVVGFESAASMKDREQFRLVAHITFKSTEMAELFCKSFENNGFRRVAKLDNNVKDTFVQAGPDVAFVWQSINQHVI